MWVCGFIFVALGILIPYIDGVLPKCRNCSFHKLQVWYFGDEDQFDLFYLVDRVLDEIELAKQAAEKRNNVTESEHDTYMMPAASPELDTSDLMDQIEQYSDHYSDQSFSPNSSSLDFKPEEMQFYQQQQQHTGHFNMAPNGDVVNQSAIVEFDMEELYLQMPNSQYNEFKHERDASIPNGIESQIPAQTVYNTNVQEEFIPAHAHRDNSEVIGNTNEHLDLNFTEMPDLNVRYYEVPKYIQESEIKRLSFSDEDSNDTYKSDFRGWTRKHPESWTTSDVLDWLFYCANIIAEDISEDCSDLRAEAFSNVTGEVLCKMGPEDFRIREPKFGLSFYQLLRKLLQEGVSFTHPSEVSIDQPESDISFTQVKHEHQNFSSLPTTEFNPGHLYSNDIQQGQSSSSTSPEAYPAYFQFEYGNQTVPVTNPSSVESLLNHSYPGSVKTYDNYNSYNYPYYQLHMPTDVTSVRAKYENGVTPIRRRPGRPRTKTIQTEAELEAQRAKKLKSQHLWEFIYELLNNPSYNPSVLKWENQSEGVFRFIQSDTVAQLWGTLKSNENMTYEKLSRAMRHYYKRGIMERVEGRRLVYKYSRGTLDKMREKHANQT